jgi:hypothetical protein
MLATLALAMGDQSTANRPISALLSKPPECVPRLLNGMSMQVEARMCIVFTEAQIFVYAVLNTRPAEFQNVQRIQWRNVTATIERVRMHMQLFRSGLLSG